MSTNRSVGRITATQENGRPARKSKKDRSPNLCVFAFADGRQCRMPRCSGHLHYCYFHAQKEAESLAAQQVGQDISRFLPTKLLTACDLGVALSRTFCAVARGDLKPKVASTLGYLAQTMLQSIPIAQHEYIESFNTHMWHNAVRFSFRLDDPPRTPAPQPAPQPPAPASPEPTPVEAEQNLSRPGREPGSSSCSSSPAPQPSVQPDPKPHTPLPPTSTEFFQQVMAGRNSSRSEPPARPESQIPATSESETRIRPGPGPEPNSSDSSSSCTSLAPPQPSAQLAPKPPAPAPASAPTAKPASSPAPQPPANCHSEPAARREEPASSSNSSPATHHSPLPQTTPSTPPPLPPTFGAPANWDALIRPKPRRRFSRHWHLLD
jgi:hypothetical protein